MLSDCICISHEYSGLPYRHLCCHVCTGYHPEYYLNNGPRPGYRPACGQLYCCFRKHSYSAGAGKIPVSGSTSWNQRSEEHTSELQSRGHLVCRLLLEKKK